MSGVCQGDAKSVAEKSKMRVQNFNVNAKKGRKAEGRTKKEKRSVRRKNGHRGIVVLSHQSLRFR